MKSLERFGGSATRTQLLRNTHLSRKEMDVALDTLLESEEIKTHVTPNPFGKPTLLIIKQQ
jgi:hypothetical protein